MSASTKLPTPSGSVGTWGAELNDFLGQSMVASTTAGATNGLLKKDHAAITDGGKVGIGTSTPGALLEVASAGTSGIYASILRGQTYIGGTVNGSNFNVGSNEDVYINGGSETSNIQLGTSGYGQITMGSGNPKPSLEDILLRVIGTPVESGCIKIKGSYSTLSFDDSASMHHIGINNANLSFYIGSLNAKLNSTAEIPKVTMTTTGRLGIGTTSPTQQLEVQGNVKINTMVNYATTAAAIADTALLAGTMYTVTTTGVKAVYIK